VKAIWHEFVISSKWQQIWLQHNSNSGNNNNKDDGSYRAAIWGLTDGGAWHEAGGRRHLCVLCSQKSNPNVSVGQVRWRHRQRQDILPALGPVTTAPDSLLA